jgi:uncharacterized membrane protein required for colicin V production
MSWFDLGAVVLVALAAFDGARSGLVWALLETTLLVGAALAARGLHGPIEPYVQKVADFSADDLSCASHAVVFAVAACLLVGILILLHPASKRWRFARDAWFGGVVGALNGALGALLLFSVVIWCSPRQSAVEESIAESRLVPVLRASQESGLGAVLPEHVPDRLAQIRSP